MNSPSTTSRWRRPGLIVEIVAVLLIKLAVITALWFAFFGPETRVEISPASVSQGLLERGPTASPSPSNHRSSE